MLTAKDHFLDGDIKRADGNAHELPGHVLPREISDTESSGSISSLSHQGAHDQVDSECQWEVLTTPPPVAEGRIHVVGRHLSFSEGKDTVSGGQQTARDKGIINKA
jgi:hypothetical protein